MKRQYRALALVALAVSLFPAAAYSQKGGYIESDLVVNRQAGSVPTLVDRYGLTHIAKFFDPHLINAWGIAKSATGAFWVAGNGAGVATLYNTEGTPQPLIVSVPNPSNSLGSGGSPTTVLFNTLGASGAFPVSGVTSAGVAITAPAVFLFASKDGSILGWNPNVNPEGFDAAKAGKYATTVVNRAPGAVYTGMAFATDAQGMTRLYAANFAGGTVDVFDTKFSPIPSVNAFVDPYLPSGYSPFNVVPVTVKGKTRMFVTYAAPDPRQLFGQGHGFVDTFELDGCGRQRFAQHGQLSAPWAVLLVPEGFGELGGTVWIGNFGDGRINAYHPVTGTFVSKVRTPEGKAILLDGLWAMEFGNGGSGGLADTLYFTAGPNGEKDGLFGSLTPGPKY
ncbi:MAG: TIGR03118 family protein [Bryobacteraceae bacterium]